MSGLLLLRVANGASAGWIETGPARFGRPHGSQARAAVCGTDDERVQEEVRQEAHDSRETGRYHSAAGQSKRAGPSPSAFARGFLSHVEGSKLGPCGRPA
jgi:hypothetical protein